MFCLMAVACCLTFRAEVKVALKQGSRSKPLVLGRCTVPSDSHLSHCDHCPLRQKGKGHFAFKRVVSSVRVCSSSCLYMWGEVHPLAQLHLHTEYISALWNHF